MRRLCLALFSGVALLACNPTNGAKHCQGEADFTLTLSSPIDSLPPDTKIEVTFGGGSEETYSLSAPNDPEVLFCEPTLAPTPGNDSNEGGANSSEGGAGGSASSNWHGHGAAPGSGGTMGGTNPVSAIECEIWSGGPATVSIRAGNWHTTRDLKPDEERCSLHETVVVGEPDPKP